MRVAVVTGKFPMLSEPFVLNQVTGALSRGWDVRVFAVQGRPAGGPVHPDVTAFDLPSRTVYPPAPPEDRAARRAAAEAAIDALEPHRPAEAAALRRMAAAPEPKWKLILRGAAMAAEGPFDVIHCQFGFFAGGMIALRDAGVLDAAVLTTFRGGDVSRYVEQEGEGVYAPVFAGGDWFYANCAFFRDRALALGCPPERLEVHGSGIDLDRFAFRPRHAPLLGQVRIGATGRLVEKKGFAYVIRALARLRAEGVDAALDIIGGGPLMPDLVSLAAALGVGEAVTFHGWRDQSDIVAILNRCHLFAAASVTAGDGDQDAPVNTLKEAMAMGLPVVASAHGGIPELVRDGVHGRLVPERDPQAIAAALAALIAEADRWPRIGAAGREAVAERYDMRRLNDTLSARYAALAASRRAAN